MFLVTLVRRLFIALAVVALLLLVVNHFIDGAIRRYYPAPRFSVDQIPNQNGRVALITGANVGLGKEMAFQLAKKGAKVVLACRSSCEEVAAEIRKTGANAIAMKLDLGDSKSIYEFAQSFRKTGLPIHMLVLNAGVMNLPTFQPTKDGLETQIAVNWLGHFYLQQLLQDIVEDSAPSRVLIMGSIAHESVSSAPPEGLTIKDTPENRAMYTAVRNYGIAKFLNMLQAKELDAQMRRAKKQVKVIAVNPGAVDTELERHIEEIVLKYAGQTVALWLKSFTAVFTLTVAEGVLTQLWAATSPEIDERDLSGSYAVPIARIGSPTALSQDVALRERVWKEGLELIKAFPRKDA